MAASRPETLRIASEIAVKRPSVGRDPGPPRRAAPRSAPASNNNAARFTPQQIPSEKHGPAMLIVYAGPVV